MKQKYNDNLTILKYIMSVLVVGIHSFTLSRIKGFGDFFIFQGISRLAVPCFFTISAYLYYNKINIDNYEVKTKKYISRLFMLMIMWGIILLPYILYYHVLLPIRESSNVKITCIQIVTQIFISMQINGFWYIYASAICVGIIYFTHNKNSEILSKSLYVVAFIAQLICVLSSTQFGFLNNELKSILFDIERYTGNLYNTALAGLSYFLMGRYIASNRKEKLIGFKNKKMGLLVSTIILCIEIYMVYKLKKYYATDAYLFLVPTTYFLILNCLDEHIRISSDRFRKYITVVTTVQYITQFSVFWSIQILAKILHIGMIPAVGYFIAVLLFSGGIAIVLLKLEDKYPKIKYMY